jgi:hypothetical protein
MNPFVEAGPAFRLVNYGLSTHGASAGAGVEMHWHALHIAPEVRYTRWGAAAAYEAGTYPQNEAVALVGFSFGGPPRATR